MNALQTYISSNYSTTESSCLMSMCPLVYF